MTSLANLGIFILALSPLRSLYLQHEMVFKKCIARAILFLEPKHLTSQSMDVPPTALEQDRKEFPLYLFSLFLQF